LRSTAKNLPRLAAVAFAVGWAALAAASSSAHTLPDTWDGVHLALVFDYRVPSSTRAKPPVDLIWGAVRPRGPLGVANGQYIRFDRDQVRHSLRWWRKHHPTWVIYRCDRRTPAREFGDPNIPIDIANPAVRRFQWRTEVRPALAEGYSAIAFDNLFLSNAFGRCGHYDSKGAWVQRYSGGFHDPQMRTDVIAWARWFRSRIHSYPTHPGMWMNFSYEFWESAADNWRLMSTADLIMDERGVTNWGNKPRPWATPSEWDAIFHSTRAFEAAGHCYLLNGQEPRFGSAIPRPARLWNIANYLLIKDRCTFMHISGWQEYGKVLDYPEYGIPIGHPTGPPIEEHGAWRRSYSNGIVLVNPDQAPAAVPLGAAYTDERGRPAGSVLRLAPHAGAVLLSAARPAA
jgi:putative glycosyl hydrolase-like family 15 (GHL15) protein